MANQLYQKVWVVDTSGYKTTQEDVQNAAEQLDAPIYTRDNFSGLMCYFHKKHDAFKASIMLGLGTSHVDDEQLTFSID